MLTKTLKFDNEVLDVLKAMQWSADGLRGVLVGGQLDRKLYEKVNKALDAMGGKWSRKDRAHVFSADPRQAAEGLIDSGSMTVERDGFFETPRDVVEFMLEIAPLPVSKRLRILEPSAGMGAILIALCEKTTNHDYYAVEKNDARADVLREDFPHVTVIHGDFLQFIPGLLFDRIYMNPPFEELQDIDHVLRAYELLSSGGILISVMSESPFFRSDKKSKAFREWLESVGGCSEKLPEGSFKESGTGVNTRLVVVAK